MASILPIDELVSSISSEAPSGVLEAAQIGQLSAMHGALAGTPARYGMVDGERVLVEAGKEPDWARLYEGAQGLFRGGRIDDLSVQGGAGGSVLIKPIRHLDVALILALCALKQDLIPGFADGLHVVDRLLKEQWDTLHPQGETDPADAEPYYARSGSLAELQIPYGDLKDTRWRWVERLLEVPLLSSAQFGGLSILECVHPFSAQLAFPIAGDPKLSSTDVDAARLDATNDVAAVREAIGRAAAALRSIAATMKQKARGSAPLEFTQLLSVLDLVERILNGSAIQGGAATTSKPGTSTLGSGAGVAVTSGQSFTGEINSRQDSIRAINAVIAYYKRNEPASPIPLLLERVTRLSGLNFMEILEELSLEGDCKVAFRNLAGIKEQPAAAEPPAASQ